MRDLLFGAQHFNQLERGLPGIPKALPKRFWLILDKGDVSVCVKPPGFDIDMLIQAELAALYEVLFGRITFTRAIHEDRLKIDSTPALMRAFPSWFALSPSAEFVRTAIAGNDIEASAKGNLASPKS